MAIERRYTEPLQVVDTPVSVERIQYLSDVRKVSKAQVVREMIEKQIDEAEADAGIHGGEERAQRVIAHREEAKRAARAAEEAEQLAHAG